MRFAAILGLLGLAACSATSPEDASTNDQAVAGTSICAPLDYGPRAAPAELYRFFASNEEAKSYVELLQSRRPVSQGFLGITDAPRPLRLVAEAFRGFQLAFPKETAGITSPPRVALMQDPDPNAYALGGGMLPDPGYEKAPWLFFVHQSLLDFSQSDDELIGAFAHEMGHLILRNGDPDVRARIYTAYQVPGDSEKGVLGSEQTNDPVIAANLEELRAIRLRTGASPELGFHAGGMLAVQMMACEECGGVKRALRPLLDLQNPLEPKDDSGPLLVSERPVANRAELDRLSQVVIDELAKSLPGLPGDRSVTIAEFYKKIGSKRVPTAEERAVDADPRYRTLTARFIAADPLLRARAVAIMTDPHAPIERVRAYDLETDSDDAAARVLLALGRDVTANGRFVLQFMTPERRDACIAAAESGKLLEYGDLRDIHPDSCWRYAHAKELERAFASCPPSGLPPRARTAGPAPALSSDELLAATTRRAR